MVFHPRSSFCLFSSLLFCFPSFYCFYRNFSHNLLNSLDFKFDQLQELKSLFVSFFQIFPCFPLFFSLRDLSFNKFTSISSIFSLSSCEFLFVSFFFPKCYPFSTAYFFINRDLSNNQISTIPESFTFPNTIDNLFVSLIFLLSETITFFIRDLSNNQISSFPESFELPNTLDNLFVSLSCITICQATSFSQVPEP